MSDKRAHIFYDGDVQGVGFRFTAERVAISLGIKGWVRNLDDGRVEVLCEGDERGIGSFLEKIASDFKECISGSEIDWEEATGEFAGFGIRMS